MTRIIENNPHSGKIPDNTSLKYKVLSYLEDQPEGFYVPVSVIINNIVGIYNRLSVSVVLKTIIKEGKIERKGRGNRTEYRIAPKWRGQTLRHVS